MRLKGCQVEEVYVYACRKRNITVENLVVSVSRSTRMESDQFSAEQGPQAISVVVLNDRLHPASRHSCLL
eukprot:scaffold3916_cov80-Cylindrotheca_fusiformis.AAC.1